MPEGQVLEFNRVTKRYGAVTAVADLSVRVEPGVVTGFLGPNGAGKTTSLRMLLGQIRPTSGTATIGGSSYSELRNPLRTVGAVLEEAAYRPRRTAARQLLIAAKSNGIPVARVDEVLRLVGLQDDADTRLGSYSLGMRQRLAVASALLGDPGVLVLDEPANGLDPEGIRWMRLLMRRLADEGRTVLVSSHVLSEIEQVADDVVVLSKGRAVYSGGIEELADPAGGAVIVDAENRAQLITALSAAKLSFDVLRSGVTVRDSNSAAVGAITAAAGVPLTMLQQRGPSLEDVFLDLVYGRRADSPRLDQVANPVAHAPLHDGVSAGDTALSASGLATAGAAAVVAGGAPAGVADEAPAALTGDAPRPAEEGTDAQADADADAEADATAAAEDSQAEAAADAAETETPAEAEAATETPAEAETAAADEGAQADADASVAGERGADADAAVGEAAVGEDVAESDPADQDAQPESDPLQAAVASLWDRPAAPAPEPSDADTRVQDSHGQDPEGEESASDASPEDARDTENAVDAANAGDTALAQDGDASDDTAHSDDPDATRVLPLATEAVSVVGTTEPSTFTELITGIPASASPADAEPTAPATEAIAVFAPLLSNDDDDDSAVDDAEDDPHLAAMRTSLSSAASRFFDGPAPAYPFSPVRAGSGAEPVTGSGAGSDAGAEPDAGAEAGAEESAASADAPSEDDGRQGEDGHEGRSADQDDDQGRTQDQHDGDHPQS
ncbi:ATP-binding cassette domain-containing protein [Microbacterium sp. MAHUQ-60]|uniref:ATP-binding cassette domain-containing protein n=1 Tax=unclassified Microbacterium TaxID=2609290 RepID=UPI00361C57D5